MKKTLFIVFGILVVICIAILYYIVCLGGIYKIDINYMIRGKRTIRAYDIPDIRKFIESPSGYEVVINDKSIPENDEKVKLNDSQKLELASLLKDVELKNAIYSPGGRAIGEQYYDYLFIKDGRQFNLGFARDNTKFAYSGSSSFLWEDVYETSVDYRKYFSKFYIYQ